LHYQLKILYPEALCHYSKVSLGCYLEGSLQFVTTYSPHFLLSEENVKILDSEVHPLDTSSVPYNFSSTASPLLHNAARALNLAARSHQSYLSLFYQRQSMISSRMSAASISQEPEITPLDEMYTGHILVSGYQVSFVLPKEFPPKYRLNAGLNDDGESAHFTPIPNGLRSRRGSIGDKNIILFMAGINMVVPYLSKPPRAPWLVRSWVIYNIFSCAHVRS